MSFIPDPDPDTALREVARRATLPAPLPRDPQATLDAGRRGSGRVDVGDLTTGDLQLLEARRELEAMRDRVRHLEQALRAAGTVLKPYLGGNGR